MGTIFFFMPRVQGILSLLSWLFIFLHDGHEQEFFVNSIERLGMGKRHGYPLILLLDAWSYVEVVLQRVNDPYQRGCVPIFYRVTHKCMAPAQRLRP